METIYEIRIAGYLDPGWSTYLASMSIQPLPGGGTLLRGPLPNQVALHALLDQIRDMNLTLTSIERIEV